MKTIISSLILGLIFCQAWAQHSSSLSIYSTFLSTSVADIRSKDPLYKEYVRDRQVSEDKRGSIEVGFRLEKPLAGQFTFKTGASMALYGLAVARLKRTTEMQREANSDRLLYQGYQRYYQVLLPFEVSRVVWASSSDGENANCRGKCSTISVMAGIAGSYMFQSDYERKYEWLDGTKEITINEFEKNFGIRSFNARLDLGLNFGINTSFTRMKLLLQPTLSHYLLSVYKAGVSDHLTTLSLRAGVLYAL